ncbi:MAG: hypothetical protein ACR2L9_01970 [Solirubrobacteraceae bacterium]
MHAAFGTVVLVVCAAAAGIAFLALLLGRKTWDDYGKGGLTLESDRVQSSVPPLTSAAADDEIRQLLLARNARRERRGERQLDVDEEISRLRSADAPRADVDPELRSEIRDLVIARSNRLVRSGKPPLDVDSEVEREIIRLTTRGDRDPSGGDGFKVG